MSFWPTSSPQSRRRTATAVAAVTARRLTLGAGRLISWWPGLVVVVVAYVAVAVGLFSDSYPNLWGGVAAAVVGLAWYSSPLRRVEARRRERLRGAVTAGGETRLGG